MVFFEKSQPAPACLEKEKLKKSGTYRCDAVVEQLKEDFKNKCYICEQKAPTSINVEHFESHRGNRDKMFDWNNLFYVCTHCNNTKGDAFDGILNCTIETDQVDSVLKYRLDPFPKERVEIIALSNEPKTFRTKDLLLAVYNGTTAQKKLEANNLRVLLTTEIKHFNDLLARYKKTEDEAKKMRLKTKIEKHLDNDSPFTAFKRTIIQEDDILKVVF
jgi:hypothetical protein